MGTMAVPCDSQDARLARSRDERIGARVPTLDLPLTQFGSSPHRRRIAHIDCRRRARFGRAAATPESGRESFANSDT
jgi:hypothetical protein